MTEIRVKKEQVMEIAFVLFLLVSFAITAVLAAYVYYKIQDQLETVDQNAINTSEALTAYNKFGVSFTLFDRSIMLIIVGLTIGLVITSFLIPAHPAFVIVNILGFILLVFLGAVYSNTYYAIVDTDETLKNISLVSYPMITNVMENLPWYAAMLVLVSSIAMYVKGRLE